jgi:hypothetical protein
MRSDTIDELSAQLPVLGLPLDTALAMAGELGLNDIHVTQTCDPRAPRAEGTLRVLRVRGNEWTVARFLDGDPQEEPAK